LRLGSSGSTGLRAGGARARVASRTTAARRAGGLRAAPGRDAGATQRPRRIDATRDLERDGHRRERSLHRREGNQYFRPTQCSGSFCDSNTHRVPVEGTASYYDVVVDGQANPDAAWYYPQPKDAAKEITNYIAFWHGVNVEA
jgi:hypothetical protein